MTSFKYLVTILGLLLAGSSTGWAADDSVDTGAASTTTAPAGPPSTPKVHHRKHHAKSTAAAAASTAPATPAPQTATSTPSTSTPRKSGGIESQPSEAPADHTSTAATATTASTPPPSGATHHSHHHHLAAEAATTNTTTAPATAGTAAAPTAVTQAKTAKGHHHRHGKPLPEPPIVVQQTSTPLPPPPPPPPVNAVTLPTPPPVSAVPIVQTGLPVARPGTGTTATLPIAPVRPPPAAAVFNFSFHDEPLPRPHTRTYPWKMGIVTTVFWIGEGSTPLSGATNKVSAWDMSWVHNNGGADDQNDMSGYASADHASTLNPFYVALPFNDLAYPEKTARWLPSGWYKRTPHGEKPVSACKDRWVEIKNRAGRYCFAQWEDVGPVVTDDAEYVFGSEPPSAMQGRGLDVSPAVAKYLGFDSTAITSWRFVDDADVLPGMWLRYDEQALLFRAMKEEMHGNPTPRIQDLDEPVPDPDDSSQKKAGAARG